MQVERVEFIKTLGRLKPALGVNRIVPELSHIWFDGKQATAYDGGFGIQLELKSDLKCGVPGVPLMSLLDTSALKEAGLEEDGSSIKVKLGKSNSKLASLESDRKVWPFPIKLPKGVTGIGFDAAMIDALKKTLFVKASPATRVEHHGVMLTPGRKNITLASTDTATIATVSVETDAANGVEFSKVLLPRDFAEQMVAQADGIILYVCEDCLIAVGSDISLYSNLLDIENADDLASVVETHAEKHGGGVPIPAGLVSALERATILSGKQPAVVNLKADGASLTIAGEYALGSVNEKLELEKMPKASISIEAPLLQRALAYADSLSFNKDSLFLNGADGFSYLMAPV